ncbi:uncharacterized protein LOC141708565 [Apium graveolens]|uniref:uncharacterized protein LOC141708565 n=1 Tax=Apium graveolens TaxID=4045 RepID=UPI003D7B490A
MSRHHDVPEGVLNVPIQTDLKFSPENLSKIEDQLRRVFIEFYNKLRLLKSFSFMNILAFSKIMKKYDKITSRNASKSYLRMVDTSYIGSSDENFYFFYKNIAFGLTLFYFEAFTGFSRQSIYDDWYMLLFNVVLTSWPLLHGLSFHSVSSNKMFLLRSAYSFQHCISKNQRTYSLTGIVYLDDWELVSILP